MEDEINVGPEGNAPDVWEIGDLILDLFDDEPFFLLLSRQIAKTKDRSIPTAGVYWNDEHLCFEMIYNPDFLYSLDDDTKKWVLMHEFYHVTLKHLCQRTLENILPGDRNASWRNYAKDLAINSLPGMIEGAPTWVLMPGRGDFEWLPDLAETSEFYARHIKNQIKKDSSWELKDESNQFDSHDGFEEQSDRSEGQQKIAEETLKGILKDAASKCDGRTKSFGKKGWGSIPDRVRSEIDNFVSTKTKINPEDIIRRFCLGSLQGNQYSSITKVHRRLPYKRLGRRTEQVPHILIAIDESASVDDAFLSKGVAVLNKFADFIDFTVAPFDTRIDKSEVFKWKKGAKKLYKRTCRGGTDFNAPTDYVNKNTEYDGLMIFTDMEAPRPKGCRVKRLWITNKINKSAARAAWKEQVLSID
jgi:predicted metal-dependent peptidase